MQLQPVPVWFTTQSGHRDLGLSVRGRILSASVDAVVDTSPLHDVFINRTDSQKLDILKNASHQIEKMLVNCKWRSKPCSHLNFHQRVLDHGVCYTFNDPVSENDVLRVQNPGSINGLYLRLNIQQELYTFGGNTAAGMEVRQISIMLRVRSMWPMRWTRRGPTSSEVPEHSKRRRRRKKPPQNNNNNNPNLIQGGLTHFWVSVTNNLCQNDSEKGQTEAESELKSHVLNSFRVTA